MLHEQICRLATPLVSLATCRLLNLINTTGKHAYTNDLEPNLLDI